MTHIILRCKKCKYISADRTDSKSQYKRLKYREALICPKCEGKKFDVLDVAEAKPPENYNNLWIAAEWKRQHGQ